MLRRFAPFWIAFLLLVAAGVWTENSLAPSFQGCINEEASKHLADDQNQRQIVIEFIRTQTICSLRLMDLHAGFFAAISGFIVAFFTYTLWWSTDKLWKAGADALTTTQRAFVFIKEIAVSFDRPPNPPPGSAKAMAMAAMSAAHMPIKTWRLYPVWENSGDTPTRRLMTNFQCRGFFGRIPSDFDFPDEGLPEPSFIGPKAVIRGNGILLSPDWLTEMGKHESAHFYIWGWADYDDVFNATPRHRTEFCFEIVRVGTDLNGFPVLQFPLHSRFNNADEECSRRPGPYVPPQ